MPLSQWTSKEVLAPYYSLLDYASNDSTDLRAQKKEELQ